MQDVSCPWIDAGEGAAVVRDARIFAYLLHVPSKRDFLKTGFVGRDGAAAR
jgi:hypothetical protein